MWAKSLFHLPTLFCCSQPHNISCKASNDPFVGYLWYQPTPGSTVLLHWYMSAPHHDAFHHHSCIKSSIRNIAASKIIKQNYPYIFRIIFLSLHHSNSHSKEFYVIPNNTDNSPQKHHSRCLHTDRRCIGEHKVMPWGQL